MCRRPMVLIRWPLDWNGPKRLRGLLDVGFSLLTSVPGPTGFRIQISTDIVLE